MELSEQVQTYQMRISRMTVDKLGVRLYDRVSAVVAELVANAYDADAENVRVRVPLSSLLARRTPGEDEIEEFGYSIEVIDDGHGMTPAEANKNFLWVGKDRRIAQGKSSRRLNRPVMGRKGIGKLAPFGICKTIEIISAGGKQTDNGYVVSHFIMDYDKILEHSDKPIEIQRGESDRTYHTEPGTIVRLKNFLPKRVPDQTTFHRQLAVRFGLTQSTFRIRVEDTRNPEKNLPFEISEFDIPLMENTRVDLSKYPIKLEDGANLPVTGWMGLAKEAYKNEELAGVRIYTRGKIVATTRDFEHPAGFTGEFTLRSYLVGEIYADWLDEDDGEDLITTNRQDILWESNYGRALQDWGAERIRAIGAASRKPRRDRVEYLFMEVAQLKEKARDRFADNEVSSTAVKLGKQIGRLAAEDELGDTEYVNNLTEFILSVAPHKALMEALGKFRQEALGQEGGVESLLDLFSKTRIAEMASYAQIARERVEAIRRLQRVLDQKSTESDLQKLIADAPWLIEATWTPITVNQGLKLFASNFEKYYYTRKKKKVTLTIGHEKKRPDFTLIHMGRKLHIVEIKPVDHSFGNDDWTRLHNYLDAFKEFFQSNEYLEAEFKDGWIIDLVCDNINITNRDQKLAYQHWNEKGRIEQISWGDFLARAVKANEEFLDAQDQVNNRATQLSKLQIGESC